MRVSSLEAAPANNVLQRTPGEAGQQMFAGLALIKCLRFVAASPAAAEHER
jgi:hypothetical protein